MIIPASPDELKSMTDEQVVEAYEKLGFSHETAVAYTHVLRPGEPAVAKRAGTFVTVETAAELAEQVGHEELAAEVAKSVEAGVGFMMLAEEDGAIRVSAPSGASIGMMLSKRLDIPGAEPDPHVLLVTVTDDLDTLSPVQTRSLLEGVAQVAERHSPFTGVIKAFAGRAAVAGELSAPGLEMLRRDLHDELTKRGFRPVMGEGILLAKSRLLGELHFEESFTGLTTQVGSFRYDHAFRKTEDFIDALVPVAKSDEEKRFTLAPMYIPGQYDSQGDWATSDDLQEALWKFQRGDKLIALQHHPEAGSMGEAVEMMVIPWEHEVPMFKADGTSYMQKFPAGTPWLGVIWNEDVWPLVKSGKVRGYSIGGRASLLNVELPGAEG